ncbi:MAG: DUF4097 domain-containing protein [Defluviitaleaceae bacterium]|nr:DUF4097 domain-containing protein [Defluviitaleaceae bacterium]
MNEKLRILKMIEDGKITAIEAAALLTSLDGDATPPAPGRATPESTERPFRAHSEKPPSQNNRSLYDSSYSDLGTKFENFAREAAPKVEKFTKTVAEKIVDATDKLSDVFVPDESQRDPQRAPSPSPPKKEKNIAEKQVEILVMADDSNELNIAGLNGNVRIRGYNGDKITARIVYASKKADAPIDIKKLGGKYVLFYEQEYFYDVSVDAFVPERAFRAVKIENLNGNLDASTLSANEIHFSNSNGSTILADISAVNFFAESSNGRLSVSKITADDATIENMNGSTEADEIDIAQLRLSNYNAPLSIIMSKFSRYFGYLWRVETGNAKLGINLPTAYDTGYHIKARAAMGEVRVGLTNLRYLIKEPMLVEAQSANIDHASRKVNLVIETSNAPLLIN